MPKTANQNREQLENMYAGTKTRRVRLLKLTIKDATLLDVKYEESDNNGLDWFDGSMKVEAFGIESVFDEIDVLKAILSRAYNTQGIWEDSDLDITALTIKYAKLKENPTKKDEELNIQPGTVLEVVVNGKIETQQCKENSLPLKATMLYSKDGAQELSYIQPDEADAIAAISQIVQDKVIQILSAPPKFKSVQLQLEMN